jgi:fumarate hydratase subunit beta
VTGRESRLRGPLGLNEVRSLQVGDTVFLSGPAYEIKTPSQYIRILDSHNRGEYLPFDLSHATIYHTFSSIGKAGGNWCLNYLGFFSSFVSNREMPDFLRAFEIHAIIGKGGMSDAVLKAMEGTCVYLAGVSGCAAYYTQCIERISAIDMEEWGLDRVVTYELRELGPLLVTMDAHRNTLYQEVEKKKQAALKNLKAALKSS